MQGTVMGLLGKLFGSGSGGDEMTPEAAEKIIQDYGAVLETSAPTPGCVADVDNLPHPKARIKEAIVMMLPLIEDHELREQLKTGYIWLSNWQEGVGSEQIGLDLMNMDPDADPLEMAKRISEQGDEMGKWTPIMQAEGEALKAELDSME